MIEQFKIENDDIKAYSAYLKLIQSGDVKNACANIVANISVDDLNSKLSQLITRISGAKSLSALAKERQELNALGQLDESKIDKQHLIDIKREYIQELKAQALEKINMHLEEEKLKIEGVSLLEEFLVTRNPLYPDIINVVGQGTVSLASIKKSLSDAKEIHIHIKGVFILDCDLNLPGCNFVIVADAICVSKPVSIDLTGKPGENEFPPKAKSGNAVRLEKNAISTEPEGTSGENGKPGAAGQSSGNIAISGAIQNGENLTIIGDGGNGAPGQDGGDGEPGCDGKDGIAPTVSPISSLHVFKTAIIDRAKPPTPGQKGGDGGFGGLGGEGGYALKALINGKWIGPDNYNDARINIKRASGAQGEDGHPGDGAKGGTGGLFASDVGRDYYGYVLDVVIERRVYGKLAYSDDEKKYFGRPCRRVKIIVDDNAHKKTRAPNGAHGGVQQDLSQGKNGFNRAQENTFRTIATPKDILADERDIKLSVPTLNMLALQKLANEIEKMFDEVQFIADTQHQIQANYQAQTQTVFRINRPQIKNTVTDLINHPEKKSSPGQIKLKELIKKMINKPEIKFSLIEEYYDIIDALYQNIAERLAVVGYQDLHNIDVFCDFLSGYHERYQKNIFKSIANRGNAFICNYFADLDIYNNLLTRYDRCVDEKRIIPILRFIVNHLPQFTNLDHLAVDLRTILLCLPLTKPKQQDCEYIFVKITAFMRDAELNHRPIIQVASLLDKICGQLVSYAEDPSKLIIAELMSFSSQDAKDVSWVTAIKAIPQIISSDRLNGPDQIAKLSVVLNKIITLIASNKIDQKDIISLYAHICRYKYSCNNHRTEILAIINRIMDFSEHYFATHIKCQMISDEEFFDKINNLSKNHLNDELLVNLIAHAPKISSKDKVQGAVDRLLLIDKKFCLVKILTSKLISAQLLLNVGLLKNSHIEKNVYNKINLLNETLKYFPMGSTWRYHEFKNINNMLGFASLTEIEDGIDSTIKQVLTTYGFLASNNRALLVNFKSLQNAKNALRTIQFLDIFIDLIDVKNHDENLRTTLNNIVFLCDYFKDDANCEALSFTIKQKLRGKIFIYNKLNPSRRIDCTGMLNTTEEALLSHFKRYSASVDLSNELTMTDPETWEGLLKHRLSDQAYDTMITRIGFDGTQSQKIADTLDEIHDLYLELLKSAIENDESLLFFELIAKINSASLMHSADTNKKLSFVRLMLSFTQDKKNLKELLKILHGDNDVDWLRVLFDKKLESVINRFVKYQKIESAVACRIVNIIKYDINNFDLTQILMQKIEHENTLVEQSSKIQLAELKAILSTLEKHKHCSEMTMCELRAMPITLWLSYLQGLEKNEAVKKPVDAQSGELNVDQLLNDMQLNLKKDNIDLKAKLKEIYRHYDSNLNINEQSITNWLSGITPKFVSENICFVIAVIMRGVELKKVVGKGEKPTPAQLIALLLYQHAAENEQGRLGQVATGEGKTLLVAMFAILQGLLGHSVNIITSSSYLAEQNAAQNTELFRLFGLNVSNNCDSAASSNLNERRKRYESSAVIYGDINSFQRDELLTKVLAKNILGNRKDEITIVDEVDSMLLDKSDNTLYLSHNIEDMRHLRQIYVEIWRAVNDPKMDENNIKESISAKLDSKEILIPRHLEHFARRRLSVWIQSAFIAKRDIKENNHYIFSGKEDENAPKSMLVMDNDTGVEQLGMQWSYGLQQFLQLLNAKKCSDESLKAVFKSNLCYFQERKSRLFGISGTLGGDADKNLFSRIYDVDFFKLPRSKPHLFKEEEGVVYPQKENSAWLDAILGDVKDKIEHNRAVLIICENIDEYDKILAHIKKAMPRRKLREYRTAADAGHVETIQEGEIILATNIAGRGMNIVTSDELNLKGGMHVVLSYMPRNIRIEEQGFGRTARQGNKGTGKFIVKDIKDHRVINIDDLRKERDLEAIACAENFRSHALQSIMVEDGLFSQFAVIYRNYAEVMAAKHDKHYIEIQLTALQDHWAFWLDEMDDAIRNVTEETEQLLYDKFAKFHIEMLSALESNDIFKFANSPHQLARLGIYYYQTKNNNELALKCFDRVIENDPDFCEIALQHKAFILSHHVKDSAEKSIFVKQSVKQQKSLLEKRITNSAMTLYTLKTIKQKHQGGVHNEFKDQIENEIKLYKVHINAIDNIIGQALGPDFLNKHIPITFHEKIKEPIEKLFNNTALFKPVRLSKKITVDESLGKKRLFLVKNGTRSEIIMSDAERDEVLIKINTILSKPGRSDPVKRAITPELFAKPLAESIWKILLNNDAIKMPKFNFKPARLYDTNSAEKKLKEIKNTFRKQLIPVVGETHYKLFEHEINQVIDQYIGKLKILPDAVLKKKRIDEVLPPSANLPPELAQFQDYCFDQILIYDNVKSLWDWNAFAVAMIGLAQVAGGVALAVCTSGFTTVIAMALINEGINDIIFGVRHGLSGDFTWSKYGVSKAVSLLCTGVSITTFGVVSAVSCPGFTGVASHITVKSADQVRGVLQNLSVTAGRVLSCQAAGSAIEKLCARLPKEMEYYLGDAIKTAIQGTDLITNQKRKIHEKLSSYYTQHGNNPAFTKEIKALMNDLIREETTNTFFTQIMKAVQCLVFDIPNQIIQCSSAISSEVLKNIIAVTIMTGQTMAKIVELISIIPQALISLEEKIDRVIAQKVVNPNTANISSQKNMLEDIDKSLDEVTAKLTNIMMTRVAHEVITPKLSQLARTSINKLYHGLSDHLAKAHNEQEQLLAKMEDELAEVESHDHVQPQKIILQNHHHHHHNHLHIKHHDMKMFEHKEHRTHHHSHSHPVEVIHVNKPSNHSALYHQVRRVVHANNTEVFSRRMSHTKPPYYSTLEPAIKAAFTLTQAAIMKKLEALRKEAAEKFRKEFQSYKDESVKNLSEIIAWQRKFIEFDIAFCLHEIHFNNLVNNLEENENDIEMKAKLINADKLLELASGLCDTCLNESNADESLKVITDDFSNRTKDYSYVKDLLLELKNLISEYFNCKHEEYSIMSQESTESNDNFLKALNNLKDLGFPSSNLQDLNSQTSPELMVACTVINSVATCFVEHEETKRKICEDAYKMLNSILSTENLIAQQAHALMIKKDERLTRNEKRVHKSFELTCSKIQEFGDQFSKDVESYQKQGQKIAEQCMAFMSMNVNMDHAMKCIKLMESNNDNVLKAAKFKYEKLEQMFKELKISHDQVSICLLQTIQVDSNNFKATSDKLIESKTATVSSATLLIDKVVDMNRSVVQTIGNKVAALIELNINKMKAAKQESKQLTNTDQASSNNQRLDAASSVPQQLENGAQGSQNRELALVESQGEPQRARSPHVAHSFLNEKLPAIASNSLDAQSSQAVRPN